MHHGSQTDASVGNLSHDCCFVWHKALYACFSRMSLAKPGTCFHLDTGPTPLSCLISNLPHSSTLTPRGLKAFELTYYLSFLSLLKLFFGKFLNKSKLTFLHSQEDGKKWKIREIRTVLWNHKAAKLSICFSSASCRYKAFGKHRCHLLNSSRGCDRHYQTRRLYRQAARTCLCLPCSCYGAREKTRRYWYHLSLTLEVRMVTETFRLSWGTLQALWAHFPLLSWAETATRNLRIWVGVRWIQGKGRKSQRCSSLQRFPSLCPINV